MKKTTAWPFAPDCEREVFIAGALTALGAFVLALRLNWLMRLVGALLTGLGGLVLYFFRDPERTPPAGENLLLSPADGRVVAIEPVIEERFVGGAATRISIFLSLFDVHVNRAPCNGTLLSRTYEPGLFGHAGMAEASELNERNTLVFADGATRIVVRQIAGLVARRIVCWVEAGQHVQRGERIGIIKFGSRVDLFIPSSAHVLVHVGEPVTGGQTIIAQRLQD